MLKPNIRFSKFDGDFKKIKLGKLASKVGSGSTPKGGSSTYVSIGIPLIRSQNVKDGYLDETDFVKIDLNTHSKMKSSHVYPNDVLLNITGASIGRSCVVPKHFIEGNVNQHVCIIRPKNKELVSTYLNYYLSSKYGQKQINISQAGGGREGLNFEAIRGFNIPITSDTEQQKIADFLTAVDTKINQLTEKHRLLKEYKKGVMQQIFSQQLRFKDKDGKTFPEWKEYAFSDFLVSKIRKTPKPKEHYLSLGVRSHVRGIFHKPNFAPEDIALDELYAVKKDDLIVNITFAWEGAIAIASHDDDGGLVSHRFPTFEFKRSKAIPEYFVHIIQDPKLRYILQNISPGGAGRNRVLNKKDFMCIQWSMPSVQEQQKIAQFLQALDSKIAAVSEQIEQTKQFKKGLLQQMFV
ncbi:restriction endonuclease subunit S [Vibrio cholerae]|nr:restriction endonuclease subunit S [Vibrio cholerae]EJY5652883.1 restriction endonuclease subunit S [Vibrio cholerae]EKF9785241.1 restriction endonuclease subunit S [Vibrio cholerae]EMB2712639.1 restriction endonuclease subunit S [Vibrio cholerae]